MESCLPEGPQLSDSVFKQKLKFWKMNLVEHQWWNAELMGPEWEELHQLTADRHVGKAWLAWRAEMKGMT